MYIKKIFDKLVSNLIVFFSFTLISFVWYYIYFNFVSEINISFFYIPYGIIVLSFLFFNYKIIFGLITSQVCIYYIIKNFKLDLPFESYFGLSLCQLTCVPITLLILRKLNMKVGIGKDYTFDKTNIYHVVLITFFSTIVLGALLVFSSLFFYNQTNLLTFTAGNLFGGIILIVLMKLLVNLPTFFKNSIKLN